MEFHDEQNAHPHLFKRRYNVSKLDEPDESKEPSDDEDEDPYLPDPEATRPENYGYDEDAESTAYNGGGRASFGGLYTSSHDAGELEEPDDDEDDDPYLPSPTRPDSESEDDSDVELFTPTTDEESCTDDSGMDVDDDTVIDDVMTADNISDNMYDSEFRANHVVVRQPTDLQSEESSSDSEPSDMELASTEQPSVGCEEMQKDKQFEIELSESDIEEIPKRKKQVLDCVAAEAKKVEQPLSPEHQEELDFLFADKFADACCA